MCLAPGRSRCDVAPYVRCALPGARRGSSAWGGSLHPLAAGVPRPGERAPGAAVSGCSAPSSLCVSSRVSRKAGSLGIDVRAHRSGRRAVARWRTTCVCARAGRRLWAALRSQKTGCATVRMTSPAPHDCGAPLAARRCQVLELQRQPAHGVQSRPIGDGRSKATRAQPVAAAGIVVAVVILGRGGEWGCALRSTSALLAETAHRSTWTRRACSSIL